MNLLEAHTEGLSLKDLLDQLEQMVPAPYFIRGYPNLARRLGVSTRAVQEIVKAAGDSFPKRRILPGMSTPVWVTAEIQEWALSRPEEFA